MVPSGHRQPIPDAWLNERSNGFQVWQVAPVCPKGLWLCCVEFENWKAK